MRDRLERRFRNARQRIQDELGNLGITPYFFTNTTKEQATKSLAAVIKALKVGHHPDHGDNSEKFKELSVIPDSQRNGVAFAQYVQRLLDESTGLSQEFKTGFLESEKKLQDALACVGISHIFLLRMTDEKAAVWLGSVIKQMLNVHHPDRGGSTRRSRQLTRILDWIKEDSDPSNFVKRLKEESAGTMQTKTGTKHVPVRKLTFKKGIKANRTSCQVRKRKG